MNTQLMYFDIGGKKNLQEGKVRSKINKQLKEALALAEASDSGANGFFVTTLNLDLNPWSPWLLPPHICPFLHYEAM